MKIRTRIQSLVIIGLVVFVSPLVGQICSISGGVEDFGTYNQAPRDVFVEGYLVFAADQHGLTIYDLSSPQIFQNVGQVLLPEMAWAVTVVDDLAFVADGSSGLAVVSIDDVENLRLLSSCATPGEARDIAVSGNLAMVADHRGGLQFINIKNPMQPYLVGSMFGVVADVDSVACERGLVYTTSSYYLDIIRLDGRFNPEVIGTVNLSQSVSGLQVSHGFVYLSGETGLTIVNAIEPSLPNVVGVLSAPDPLMDVSVSGGLAFLASESGGLEIADVADPADPQFLGTMATPGGASGVACSGQSVFVSDPEYGLWVVDVSDPWDPQTIGHVEAEGKAVEVAVKGETAYVADDLGGLVSVDISDPDEPDMRYMLHLPGEIRDLVVVGDVAYLAAGTAGLEIVDLSDPDHPQLLGNLVTPDSLVSVAVSESRVYLGADPGGLVIVDASDLTNPVLLNTDSWISAQNLAVDGNALYVAQDAVVRSFDVEDPYKPVLADIFIAGGGGSIEDLETRGKHLFLTGEIGIGLQILDISRFASMSFLGSCPLAEDSARVYAMGEMAFVSGQSGGIQVINISDLSRPKVIDTVETNRRVGAIAGTVANSTLWAAEGAILEGIRFDCPDCDGLEIGVDPETILTGETSEITVSVKNGEGDPVEGQAVVGSTDLGDLSEFVDLGNGQYRAVLSSENQSGIASVSVSVNAWECQKGTQVRIECADGAVEAPAAKVVSVDDSAVELTWTGVENAVGYRVLRGGFLITELGPEVLSYCDASLSPGMEFSYVVSAIDPCGGLWPSAELNVSTTGDPIICPESAGRSDLSYRNDLDIGRISVLGSSVYGADRIGMGIWDFRSSSEIVHQGHWQAPSPGRGVAVTAEGLAILADGDSGLFLIDVKNPSNPHLLSSFATEGYAENVEIVGTFAFVAERESGVELIDVSDPLVPRRLGFVDTPGEASAMAPSGSYLFVADGSEMMTVIDFSDPSSLGVVASLDVGSAIDIALLNGRAYLAGRGYLKVVDISDPLSPSFLGSFGSADDYIWAVDASAGSVFVTDGPRVERLDVRDPAHIVVNGHYYVDEAPVDLAFGDGILLTSNGRYGLNAINTDRIGFVETAGEPVDLVVEDRYAYALLESSTMSVLDLSDPLHPVLVASLPIPGEANSIAIEGDIASISCGAEGLALVDIHDPSKPSLVSVTHWENALSKAVAGIGNVVCMADALAGLVVIDISDPESPVIRSIFDIEGGAFDVAAVGTSVFVVGGDGRLSVIDVSDPENPQFVNTVPDVDAAQRITICGDRAFVSVFYYWTPQIRIVDISNPSTPRLIGIMSSGGGLSFAVGMAGNTVYLASRTGLGVYSMDEQGQTRLLGVLALREETPRAVALSQNAVYVASGAVGLDVFDVGDTANPTDLPTVYQTRGETFDVAVDSTTAYVADGWEGLEILDVSDVASPRVLGHVDSRGFSRQVVAADHMVYLADGDGGLRIFDAVVPETPIETASVEFEGAAVTRVFMQDQLVYAIAGSSLKILDVVDPTDPQLLGSYELSAASTTVEALTVSDDVAYLATWSHGVYLIDVSDPQNPILLSTLADGAWDIEVAHGVAYVSESNWMSVYDVWNPAAPVKIQSIELPLGFADFDVSGSLIFAGFSGGISIYDLSRPDEPRFVGTEPISESISEISISGDKMYLAEETHIETMTLSCRPPRADFEVSVMGRSVEVRNRSLYGSSSHVWEFGDGSSSADLNTSHSYGEDGSYVVRLTEANAYGEDSYEQEITVKKGWIFFDGFETGDFSGWSSVVDGP